MAEISLQDFYGNAPQPNGAPPPAAPGAISLEDFYGPATTAPPPQAAAPDTKVIGAGPNGEPIYANPQQNEDTTKAMGDYNARMSEKGLEGLTAGMAPFVEAPVVSAVTGKSLPEGLQTARDYSAETSKQFPGSSATAEAVGSLPTALVGTGWVKPAGSLAGRVGQGMLLGGGTSALDTAGHDIGSGNTDNIGSDVAKSAATGVALGGAIPAVAGAAARVISPNIDPNVKLLMDRGVTPTPGQIIGGSANRVEEAAQSIPFVGDAIKAARRRAVGDFNTAAINDALAPIGQSLNPATPLGRDAISEAGQKIQAQYSKLVPSLSVTADPTFASNVANLRNMAQSMVPERAAQFDKVLDQQVLSKFSPSNTMTGESFKETESTLGRLASDYRHSAVADERQLGGAFLQLQQELRGVLTRSNPDQGAALSANNLAYAKYLRIQDAAANLGAGQGVFSPAQLLSSVKSNDPTLHHRAFAQGDALAQELADAGKSVLGSKVPDSGTTFRAANMAALPALYEGFQHAPAATAAGLAAGGAGMAAYSPPGQAALATILARRPAGAQGVADALRKASPRLGAMAPIPLASMAAGQQP